MCSQCSALAGELRWISSKDVALQRKILREARELEDRYFASLKSEKGRKSVARNEDL